MRRQCGPLRRDWKDQQDNKLLKFLTISYLKNGIKRGPYELVIEHREFVIEDINSWTVEFSSEVWITSKFITKFWWLSEIIEEQKIVSHWKQTEFRMTANDVHTLFIMIIFYSSTSLLRILFEALRDLEISSDSICMHIVGTYHHCLNHEFQRTAIYIPYHHHLFCCLWMGPWNESDCKRQ